MASRQPCLSSRTSADRSAFCEEPGTGGPMDRAVDTTPAEQRGICSIDDCIDLQPSDVAERKANPRLDFGEHHKRIARKRDGGSEKLKPLVSRWDLCRTAAPRQ